MKQMFSCPVELALEVRGGKWRATVELGVRTEQPTLRGNRA